jgi:hypothetical protein
MKNNFTAHFAATFVRDFENIEEILQPCSDEDIFDPSGQGNRYNLRIWWINILHSVIKDSHKGQSPVRYSVMCQKTSVQVFLLSQKLCYQCSVPTGLA